MSGAAQENLRFTEKAITEIQRMSIDDSDGFALAVTKHLCRFRRIIWDDARALFWVLVPHKSPQVAVWLMPVANRFAPDPGSPFAGLGVFVDLASVASTREKGGDA